MWEHIYENGEIHKSPSELIRELVDDLINRGVKNVLDAGCGAGRHSEYLSNKGFNVTGVDISKKAIELAKKNRPGNKVRYFVAHLENLPISDHSMDFVIANHSLEYCENFKHAAKELTRVLRPGMPLFLRVVSSKHIYAKASANDVKGFSHVGECIKNERPVHFFTKKELESLFPNYTTLRLEHRISQPLDDLKIDVPLAEWIYHGIKKIYENT